MYDPVVWGTKLAAACKGRLNAELRTTLETIVRLCGSSHRVLSSFARVLVDHGDYTSAEALFVKHMLKCPYADLWVVYTEYVVLTKLNRVRTVLAAAPPDKQAELQQSVLAAQRAVLDAYDFAAQHVGSSIDSAPLWRAYCLFVSSLPTDTTYAAAQSRELRRKAYSQAVACAHDGTDELWQQYTAFEKESSPAKLAESLIGKLSSDQGTASAVYRERKSLWKWVDMDALPLPPPRRDTHPQAFEVYTQHANAQLAAWRRIISYEKSNPMHVSPAACESHISLVYRQALTVGPCRYSADLWLEYAQWKGTASASTQGSVTKADSPLYEAVDAILTEALSVLPTCVSLAIAVSEWYEANGHRPTAMKVLSTLLNTLHDVADGKHSAWRMSPVPGVQSGSTASAMPEDDEEAPPGAAEAFQGTAAAHGAQHADRVVAALAAMPDGGSPLRTLCRAGDESDAARAIPHVYVVQQRVARRVEGMDAARAVFSSARKSKWCTARVYLSSAQLEWSSNRALPVARNILEAARKKWPQDVEFAVSACDFLSPLDDSTNVRAFYEACLAAVKPANSRPLWDRYIWYELCWAQGGGSLTAVLALEARRASVHAHLTGPEVGTLLQQVHRQAVYLPANVGLQDLGPCDAELFTRLSYTPFTGVHVPPGPGAPLQVQGMAGGQVQGTEAPSIDTALKLLHGANVSTGQRDGLYLQAPPLYGSLLSHVGLRDTLTAVSSNKRTFSIIDDAPEASNARSVEKAHERAPAVKPAAAPASASTVPTYVEPPRILHGFLSRLPAYDPSLGQPPEADAVLDYLLGNTEVVTDVSLRPVGVKRPRSET